MARHRGFEEDVVVDRALELFWERGHAATSVQDLVDHLGINRGSIYRTFGSKDGLYRRALDRYSTAGLAGLEEALAGDAALADRFGAYLEKMFAEPDVRGCFVGRSVAELGCRHELGADAAEGAAAMLEILTGAATVAQRTGRTGWKGDPEAWARTALATIQGLHIMVRAGATGPELQPSIEAFVGALR